MANDNAFTFNPFSIGPPNRGASLDIKIPTCPSYPPPVFAITPKPKVHTNRSVSQDSMPEMQSKLSKMVGLPSQIGEVAISKAINEEMAISKQQAATADENQRIYAGGGNMPSDLTKDVSDTASLRTLLPVRTCSVSNPSVSSGGGMQNRTDSKSSVKSRVSAKTNLSPVSKASKKSQDKSKNVSSKMSLKSHESSSRSKASISNLSKVTKASRETSQSNSKNIISRTSVKSNKSNENSIKSNLSKTSKISKKSTTDSLANSKNVSSKMSVRSDSSSTIKSGETIKSSKKAMNVSIKKSVTKTVSEITLKPLESSENNHRSKHSFKSTTEKRATSGKETGNVSHHSIQSKKNPSSRIFIQQKPSNQGENISQHSRPLKKELLPIDRNQERGILKKSTPITPPKPSHSKKTLAEEVNEVTNRLKAGNVNSFRRFNSLLRAYTNNAEPEMLCRDDRMSQWFKEAVLS